MAENARRPARGREEAVPTELSPMELLAGQAAARASERMPSRQTPTTTTDNPSSSSSSSSSGGGSRPTSARWVESPAPREKARTITRLRPIRSCTECRLNKRKCDRARPVCKHCIDTGRRDRCRFLDGGVVRARRGESASSAVASPSPSSPSSTRTRSQQRPTVAAASSSSPRPRDPSVAAPSLLPVARGSPEYHAMSWDGDRRSSGVAAPPLHSSLARLRYEALVHVLADHNDLVLPSIDELDALLALYRSGLEPFLQCAMVDLNAPRYERCLRWWRHGLQSSSPPAEDEGVAPPDPTSFTLMLVVLALGMQIGEASARPEAAAAAAAVAATSCSPQRKLIRVAGDCIDALQAACPPSWATVFVVPMDLIKAAVLRGRWFLSQLQLQMARSCCAAAVHLACAAGLHRDGHHWPTMRPEEAESRRQLWWCIVSEYLAAHRLDTSTVLLPAMAVVDAALPTSMQSIETQLAYVRDTYPESLLLRRREPLRCDAIEVGFHTTRARWVELRLQRTTWRGNEGRRLSADRIADLEQRQDDVAMRFTPAALRWSDDDEDQLLRCPAFDPTDASLDQRHFVERAVLHLEHSLARLELHMPSIVGRDARPRGGPGLGSVGAGAAVLYEDAGGNGHGNGALDQDAIDNDDGNSEDHESSLQRCLGAAQALVGLVAGLLPARPPPVLLEPLLHGALLAGMVLAVALGLGAANTSETTAVLLRPLLRRLLRALASKEAEPMDTVPRSVTEYAGKVHRFLSGMTQLTPGGAFAAARRRSRAAHERPGAARPENRRTRGPLSSSTPTATAASAAATATATATATTATAAAAVAEVWAPTGSATSPGSAMDTSSWGLFSVASDASPFAEMFANPSPSDASSLDNGHAGELWKVWQAICGGQVLLEDAP